MTDKLNDAKTGFAADATNVLRGLCMGAADIVPGVSGGTIALILGHYERLVSAIGRIDREFLSLLAARKLRLALAHIDFRFLVALGFGIAIAIVALASLMNYLLSNHQAYTYAVFFGLIVASSYLVAMRLTAWSLIHPVIISCGGLVAWQICKLDPVHGALTPLSAFLAATIAICAMILPGISGAFVLLLLGLYHPIMDLIKGLPHGEITGSGLLSLAAFGAGCLLGLLSFSRVLKWLLENRHDGTMAFLLGLMIGSLVKIWPFQRITEDTIGLEFKEQRFELIWPSESPASLSIVVVLAVVAGLATFGLEQVGKRFQ